jgi:thymidylate synthase
MNMFALTDLQRHIAGEISTRLGRKIRLGRYVDISDSFHIYGSYATEFRKFRDSTQERAFADRVWNTSFAQPFFQDARRRLAEEAT